MSDELLTYYNRELSFIRRLAGEFAAANPKIAGRLRLGPDSSEDPHVERLIEAFAFLNARTRHKLDDDLPEITDALLGVLYPHYLAPVPSMAVVQLGLDPSQTELPEGHVVPRGAPIETEAVQGEPCRFRTCYPATLWPIEVRSAALSRPPFAAPDTPASGRAAGMLRLVLRAPGAGFAGMKLGSLRFFLKGQAQHVFPLYELLFNNVVEVAVAASPRDPAPTLLRPDSIKPVGFEADEGMLPYSARSFLGYRLLTEFFAFPDKFLFFDFTGLDREALASVGNQLELFVFFNKLPGALEQNVTADTFRLGCTPVVNLFRQRAEPISLTHTEWEYRVVPDARRPQATEIYSIDGVTATSPDGERVEFVPFFSVKHAGERGGQRTYWYSTRRPAGQSGGQIDHGTEVYLSLVNLGFQPSAPAEWIVDVQTTCLNRDLPHRLPFGGDQPRLMLTEGGALVSEVRCLTHPTSTLRPPRKHAAMWRLISHLTLNHLSIAEQGEGAAALQEILALYDYRDSAETRSLIEGVLDVKSRRVVSRALDGRGGVCRGVEVTVQLDEERFAGSGMFLFASVLERFFGLYCSINAFSRTVATVKGRPGELRRWAPRAGERLLL